MYIFHDFHLDNDLNKALLILENSEIELYIIFNYRSTNEIEEIKRFAFEATECEKKIITEYCKLKFGTNSFNRIDLNSIDNFLSELRRLEGRSFPQIYFSRLWTRLCHHLGISRNISDFEDWYDNNYSKQQKNRK